MAAKKILILTASIGSGHIKAAEAVAQELKRQQPETEIVTVDFMARSTSFWHWLTKKIYLEMLNFVPNLYDVFYKLSSSETGGSCGKNMFAYFMLPVFERLQHELQPDGIICTHPFPAGTVSLWKEKHQSNLPLSVVMTDYSLHQMWLCSGVENYFMATEAMRQSMMEQGFAAENLHVTGIPISSEVLNLPNKAELRRELGFGQERKVILLMGGGLGLGGIERTLQELEKIEQPLTLLVIAGRNSQLQQQAEDFAEGSHHTIRVWGYTEEVRKLMGAADLLITKPGALTISEAFALGTPMLLHDPIPGPETENAVYATKHGAAVWLHPGEKLAGAVEEIFHCNCLEKMHEQALQSAKPLASQEIVKIILRSAGFWADHRE
ncbi:MGDG synthase family glycosyltransferase [Selenomonas ruminantium]|uniref:Processive 1,2-diacylglycerol beta-glucosyltransferase n=1 Tax=Selenomonas ruminantium TaxID=971 RepID=A0A1I0X532_SELRU|nr:glycosyltransferase [Selenomonas ruminantium]SFA95944.1 processive 1,2-diacylglycerol beta-glucosyltransferase [Selenomonas ruminantium]